MWPLLATLAFASQAAAQAQELDLDLQDDLDTILRWSPPAEPKVEPEAKSPEGETRGQRSGKPKTKADKPASGTEGSETRSREPAADESTAGTEAAAASDARTQKAEARAKREEERAKREEARAKRQEERARREEERARRDEQQRAEKLASRRAAAAVDAQPDGAPEEPAKKSNKRDKEQAAADKLEAKAERLRAKRERQRRAARSRAGVPSEYLDLIDKWHAPPLESELAERAGVVVPALVFRVVHDDITFSLTPETTEGGFGPDALRIASEGFGGEPGGPVVCERLLNLIYEAMRHFGVPYVHLISGVRRDRSGSRHTHGLAADVVLPGVDDEELAAFFRPHGFLGVGVYTRSGFVHIDVREKSFFWIDPSLPGKRIRVHQVRGDEAKAIDEAALARGVLPYDNPLRLQKALEKRAERRRRDAIVKRPTPGPAQPAAAPAGTSQPEAVQRAAR